MRLALLALLSVAMWGQNTLTTTRLNMRPYTPSGAGASIGELRFYDVVAGGGSYISLIGQGSVATNYTLTLPKTTSTLLAQINYQYHDSQAFPVSMWRARGTEASPTDLSSGDTIYSFVGIGRVGSAWISLGSFGTTYYNIGGVDVGWINFETRNAGVVGTKLSLDHIGNLIPASTAQNIGLSSGRWGKGWFTDMDVSGTCTGCGGAPPITWTLETNDDILTMQHHLASGTTARNILSQYSRGTNASPSAAVAGDAAFSTKWQYYAGGAYRDAGAIFVNVPSGATVSGTSSPGHLSIFATKHAETSGTEVVRLGAQTASETPAFGAKFFAGAFPSTNLTIDLGAFGAEWLTVWASRISTSGSTDIGFYPGNALRWTMDAADFGSLAPATDAAAKLGTSTLKLHSVWSMAYNTYTHNSWGVQTNDWAADNSLYHQLTNYGTATISAVEMRKARGTQASPTAVSNGDILGYHFFEGYSPSGTFPFSAYIQSYVDGAPSGSVVSGAVAIGTMNAAGSVANRFIVRASGDIEIPGNLTVSGTCTGCGSGGTPPIDWYLNTGGTVLTLGNHGTVSANQIYTKFSRGTQASPTDAATGDRVMGQVYQYYASGYKDTAAILVNIPTVSASVSGSSSPSVLGIYATDRLSTTNGIIAEFGAHGAGYGMMIHRNVWPSSNNSFDFGASGYEWYQAWVTRLKATSTMEIHTGGSHRWNIASGTGSLTPNTDGGPNFGSSLTKVAQSWAQEFFSYTSSAFGTQQHDFSADANLNMILSTFSSSSAGDRASIQMHRYRGSLASPSAVLDNDQLGVIAFQGYSPSSGGMALGATIRAYVDGTPASAVVPTELLFETMDGFGFYNTNLTIRASGDVQVRNFLSSPYISVTAGTITNGTPGVDATLTCGSGEAVKNITVKFGIVTAVSCGTP